DFHVTGVQTCALPISRGVTAALYLAIGALVAAAVLGAYFIIVGDQANVAGRAWLTLFLVALFAGAVVLDANVSSGPNRWYLGVSTIVNVVLVAVGLLKLWNGWLQPEDTDRKSTRLNSSHVKISYAVFCLKKKKHKLAK